MKEWIWKTFVRDHENLEDPQVRERYTKLTGNLGILVNSLLCVMKIILGLMIHSIAVVADGLHDMADSMAACITLIGAHIARKPADKDHPYGHARIEYLTSLLISAIVLVVGWELLTSSVQRCLHPSHTDFSWLMVIFMLAAILIKGSSALFTIATGKHIRSLPVIAAGTDNRNDVITSIIIVAGMLISHYTGLELDGYMGCIVSLFILWSGVSLIRQTIHPLLGEPPDPDTVKAIQEIIMDHPQVLGVHDLIIYNYGPGKSFVSFHAEVDSRENLLQIHDAIDHIEHEIFEKLRITATCHMDPVELDNPIRIQMQDLVAENIRAFDEIESFHDLRVVPGSSRTRIIFDAVATPGKKIRREEIIGQMNRAVKEIDPSYEVIINFDQAFS